MAARGKTAALVAGLLLSGAGLTAGLRWRPLVRAWHIRELRKDPGKLAGYDTTPEDSLRWDALREFLATDEGAGAFLSFLFGEISQPDFLANRPTSPEDHYPIRCSAFMAPPSVFRNYAPLCEELSFQGKGPPGVSWSSRMKWGGHSRWLMLSGLDGRTVRLRGTPWWQATVKCDGDNISLAIRPTPAEGARPPAVVPGPPGG